MEVFGNINHNYKHKLQNHDLKCLNDFRYPYNYLLLYYLINYFLECNFLLRFFLCHWILYENKNIHLAFLNRKFEDKSVKHIIIFRINLDQFFLWFLLLFLVLFCYQIQLHLKIRKIIVFLFWIFLNYYQINY